MRVRSALARIRGSNSSVPELAPAAPDHGSAPSQPAGPIWIVTPCKGRLSFVQQTLGRFMSHPEARCCVVDYSCPDKVGDWVESTFPNQVAAGRLVVERVLDAPLFNKCRAHNVGARRARAEGAEYLCFLDADTLVEPDFHDFIRARAAPNRFLIAGLRDDGSDMPSMTGLLVVHGSEFEQVGGFDEEFAGWGGEDVELRLRLHLLRGLEFMDVPLSLTRPIPHGDNLRSRFYRQGDIIASNAANMERIYAKIHTEWRGRLVRPRSSADRLWFKHSWAPFLRIPEGSSFAQRLPEQIISARSPAHESERGVQARAEAPRLPRPHNERVSRRVLAATTRARRF